MGYIGFILRVLFLLFIIIVVTKLLREVAYYIGKEFGIVDFFIQLWNKTINLFQGKKRE